jgi:hypothetical protein
MNQNQKEQVREADLIRQFINKLLSYCNEHNLKLGEDLSIGEVHDSIQIHMRDHVPTEHQVNVETMLKELQTALTQQAV